jgi:hypothetical protein
MEMAMVLERVSGWLIGAVLPLIYITVGVRIIEVLLTWGHHPLGFRGVYLLKSDTIPGSLGLPAKAGSVVGRVGGIQYLIRRGREILFVGRPSIFRTAYLLRARGVDLGGATRLEVSAPLSVCLAFVGVCALFVGLGLSGFLADGFVVGMIYLLIGLGILAFLWWTIRRQVAMAPDYLEDILEDLREAQADNEEAT